MPTLRANGTELYYEVHGTGQQTVFLAHGLALSGRMYHHQVMPLRQRFRCITMDFRGQGRSAVAETGYDMDTLARDVATVLQRLDAAPCHYVGLSMGGFVGLRLALEQPRLLRSLTLVNTGADADSGLERLRGGLMAATVKLFGMRPVTGSAMRLLFGPRFNSDPVHADERRRWRNEVMANDRTGIVRAATGVRRRASVLGKIGNIDLPTLIIAGAEDRAVPPIHAQRLHAGIEGSRLVVLAGAGHNCCLEQPDAVNEHLLRFFDSL